MQTNQLMTALPLSDVEKMAVAIAKSGLFGVKTADQALALMLVAQAEGMHPAIAARDYHIIEGRPALKADAMLARFHSCGGIVEWHDLSDKKVSATFSHPQGGKAMISWTWEMAERAQLTQRQQRDGKPNMWQKFPRQLLRSRVVSEGIRTVFPGVAVGTYTPEEIQDMEEPRNVTPQHDPEPPKKSAKKSDPKPEPKPEIQPDDAVIIARDSEGKTTIIPESKPETTDQQKTGAAVAAEIKEIRSLCLKQGIKTSEDFSRVMESIILRKAETASALSHNERAMVLSELRKYVKEAE